VNNQQPHPIELALAITLSSIEALLWLINELLGFHTATATETVLQALYSSPLSAGTASYTGPTYSKDYILTLTVKQLRSITGIKTSRFNKAALIDHALLFFTKESTNAY
jgi:hypothetical protein